jgi:hypothetical protein
MRYRKKRRRRRRRKRRMSKFLQKGKWRRARTIYRIRAVGTSSRTYFEVKASQRNLAKIPILQFTRNIF